MTISQKGLLPAFLILLVSGESFLTSEAKAFDPAQLPGEEQGTVYIYRTNSFPESISPTIQRNGRDILILPNSSYTWLHLSEGMHEISVIWPEYSQVPNMIVEVIVDHENDYFLRVEGRLDDSGFYVSSSESLKMPKDKALREISECCSYVSPKKHD